VWKHLFSNKSSSERGTLYQLKNLLHRTRVPANPGDNVKAAEDLLLVVLHGHVIAAANAILSGAKANDVMELSKSIVEHFVHFNLPSGSSTPTDDSDKVCLYATEVLTLGTTSMTQPGKGMVTGSSDVGSLISFCTKPLNRRTTALRH